MRSFSVTMHMKSPSAYSFLRRKFNSNLPHESTIRKWYANCGSNGQPGIQKECLNTLRNLINEFTARNEVLCCSLAFDEIALKQVVQWCHTSKTFLGYISYGSENGLQRKIATHAIVFLLSGINSKFSIPIAYQFITGLNTNEKMELVKAVLTELTSNGVRVVNITFDGLNTNFSVCTKLGASFNERDFRPYFPDPVDGHTIYIILDPCHMLKLWRNILAANLRIHHNRQEINWLHIVKLETHSTKNEFINHRLTRRHIQWDKDKMNVRLAVETLSRSVSNSLKLLMENGVKGFENLFLQGRWNSQEEPMIYLTYSIRMFVKPMSRIVKISKI